MNCSSGRGAAVCVVVVVVGYSLRAGSLRHGSRVRESEAQEPGKPVVLSLVWVGLGCARRLASTVPVVE
jgi:hypothetical protein